MVWNNGKGQIHELSTSMDSAALTVIEEKKTGGY